MQYVTCAEARPMKGLRLVLSVGGPNPWGEAAKAIFHVRQVPYVAVGRVGMDDDPDIFAWTSHRNVPVAMYNEEKPRSSWLDILYLAERIGSGPSLLPETRESQVECIGVSHQICGEDGFGWNRRLDIFGRMVADAGGDPAKTMLPARLFSDYLINAQTITTGTRRLIEILTMLHNRIERQKRAGLRYLVGDQLTATDLHFATLLGMVDPLPPKTNPMPDFLRDLYSSGSQNLRDAVTPTLRAHRDFIYETALVLPMEF